MIDYANYTRNEKRQKTHRILNTILSLMVIFMGWKTIPPIYEELSGLTADRIEQEEIAQIVEDEGYKPRPYKDSRGLWTIGFGHLIKEDETFLNGINAKDAIDMLRKDYEYAKYSVEQNYPWAVGEVKLVLTNMTYQMGATGVSNFKMALIHLKEKKWDEAAGEMLNSVWARQTPNRASRLAGRIMALENE